MIIHIRKSNLFTSNPDVRFSREYNLPRGTWTEIWKRYKLLGYTVKELCDFYEIKTKRKTSPTSMSRWIWRSEVYSMAKPMIDKGVCVVMSSFFGEYEWEVVKELSKNLKSSVKHTSKTLI